MTISVGERLPEITLVKAGVDGPEQVSSADYFAGRRIALFAVPGAFTPTCSARHLPGYVEKGADLKTKGVDEIACISVNDAFVMAAWAKATDAQGIMMLADGNGDFARAVGLSSDSSKFGMGTRSQRYAMIVDDGVVTALHVERPGEFKVSSADHLLSSM